MKSHNSVFSERMNPVAFLCCAIIEGIESNATLQKIAQAMTENGCCDHKIVGAFPTLKGVPKMVGRFGRYRIESSTLRSLTKHQNDFID